MKKVFSGGVPLLWVFLLPFLALAQKDTTKTDTTRVIKTALSVSDQYKKFLPNYSPLSPNAAGMQQLFDYPVNLATGNADIPIVLYTINEGGISHPITLRYQATGHRLKSLASWVGWGWTLDYGSPINRSLQGRPDDAPISANYLTTPILTSDAPDLCSNLGNYTFANRIRNNTGDAQPDIFSYGIGGKSGKFILGQGTNDPYLIPFQPIKINKSVNSFGYINAFELIDDDGKAYHFGVDSLGNPAVESQNTISGQTSDFYISTWQLTQIKSPNTNDHLNFYYQNGGSITQEDKQWSVSIISNAIGTGAGSDYYTNTGSATANPTTVSTTSGQSNIHKITFTNGEIEFVQNGSGETRQDQPSSKYLKQINIYNYENGTKRLQKVIEFSYSYFKDADSSNGRLKLDRVRFRDTTNTVQLDHTFEYHTNFYSWTDNNIYQPRQDFFGYYNGYSNQSLIGLSSYNVGTTQNPNNITITNGGANRSTVATYMKQGVLKKITYPTNGFTTFDYETNQYQYNGTTYLAGGLRVKEIKSYPSANQQPITKRYVYGTADSVGIGYFTTNWFPQSANVAIQQSLRYATLSPAGSNASATQHIITPSGQLDVGSFDVSPVYYTWVKEYFEDDTAQVKNGRNEYNFGFRADIIASVPQYYIRDVKTWLRGQLLEKRTYDSLNVLRSKTTNTYTEYKTDLKTVAGWVNTPTIFEGNAWSTTCSTDFLYPQGIPEMIYNSYEYPTGHLKLTTSTSVLDSVSTTETYTYDNNLFVKKTETSDSYANHKRIQESVYTTDASYDLDTEVLEMRSRNMVGLALETIEKEDLNGTINTLFKQKTVYERFTGNNARGLTNNPLPKEIWVAPTGGTLEKRVEYTAYDSDGNPTEYKVDGISTALVWGYKKSLLLAQIQNATISAVNTALTTAGITAESYSVNNLSNAQLTALATFRNALPNSLVTWYCYRPHIGMSSSIAPNGLKSGFEYDTFQRLKTTRDNENAKLKEYQYFYGTPLNKIRTTIFRTSNTSLSTNNLSPSDPVHTFYVEYFDGLGRLVQKIGERQGFAPNHNDIVLDSKKYDAFGRVQQETAIAPTNSSDGSYQTDVVSLAQSFYGDTSPFTIPSYEASPLNRLRNSFGIGNDWHAANKKWQFFDESAGSTVRYYTIDATGNITLSGFYPAHSLFKKRSIDEQGNTTIEFTDKRGRLVQKQVEQSTGDFLTTYYINDGLGRPLAILQPNAYALNSSIAQSSTSWSNGVFFYKYDSRGRITEKHIPNGGFSYMVYDKADRLVLEQDEYQRVNNLWSFQKYDGLGRSVLRGELTQNTTRSSLQAAFGGHSVLSETFDSTNVSGMYYSDVSFPFAVDSSKVMEVDFYDNYAGWRDIGKYGPFGSNPYPNAKGLLTGTIRRYTENHKFYTKSNYYDSRNRWIYSRESKLTSSTPFPQTNFYTFANELYYIDKLIFTDFTPTINLYKTYIFDHVGRKTFATQFINSQSTEIKYRYNTIGQLVNKIIKPSNEYEISDTGADYINRPPALEQPNTQDIANKAVIISPPFVADSTTQTYLAEVDTTTSTGLIKGLQNIDYQYNIRGQMNCINCRNKQVRLGNKQNDLFSMKLDYHEDKRYYDGNISRQTWKTPYVSNAQVFKYDYDASSRLLKAKYSGGNTGSDFSLDTLRYDRNGNILQLKRIGHAPSGGWGSIDDLAYIYDGNKLLSVSDGTSNSAGFNDGNTTGNDYGYWANGALKFDKNKGIDSIFYNSYLKKVSRVKFSNGNWINFFYLADGTLWKRKLSNNDTWIYQDELILKNNKIYQLNHDEGRAVRDTIANKWVFEYDYRDIWGNLRVSFRDSLATPVNGVYKPPVVTQTNDYDAFGFEISSFTNSGSNNFLYQNQERINDFGIGIDFFKFRPSDYLIGRFWQIDPLAEKYVYNSPYALQENKFGLGIELEGLELAPIQSQPVPQNQRYLPAPTNDIKGFVGVSGEAKMGVSMGFLEEILGIGNGVIIDVGSTQVSKLQVGIPTDGNNFGENGSAVFSQGVEVKYAGFGGAMKREVELKNYGNEKTVTTEKTISMPFVSFSMSESTKYIKEGKVYKEASQSSDFYISAAKTQARGGIGPSGEVKAELKFNSVFLTGGGSGYIDQNSRFIMRSDNTRVQQSKPLIKLR